jgi:hypothetical protein
MCVKLEKVQRPCVVLRLIRRRTMSCFETVIGLYVHTTYDTKPCFFSSCLRACLFIRFYSCLFVRNAMDRMLYAHE